MEKQKQDYPQNETVLHVVAADKLSLLTTRTVNFFIRWHEGRMSSMMTCVHSCAQRRSIANSFKI